MAHSKGKPCTLPTACCVQIPLKIGTLAIAIFSMVESILGIAILSVVAYFIWITSHAAVNSGNVDKGSDAMKWHQEMYGGIVVMALVDFFIAIFAGVLIYGVRKGQRSYMQPWMMVEASKDIIYFLIGLLSVAFSSIWATYIVEVAAAAATTHGTTTTFTQDSMATLCRTIGSLLMIYSGIFFYFLMVVVSFYKMSKNKGVPEDQVRPMLAAY